VYSNLFYFMLYVQMALLNEFYCGHGYGFCCLCGMLLCSILKQSVGLSVLCEYAIAPYFAYCRIFQQSVLIAYFPPHKLAFLTTIYYSLCFYYLFQLGFITSAICLPTEWHHPCVRTPVERDGVVVFEQFCTIFLHISATSLVIVRSAYFFKCSIKLTCLNSNMDSHLRGKTRMVM